MQTQGTLEYAIRDMLRGRFSDQLNRMGITERGVSISSADAGPGMWFASGMDADGTDDDVGLGAINWGQMLNLRLSKLIETKARLGQPVVRKSEIMEAVEPEIKQAASRMAEGMRSGVRQQIEKAEAGILGPEAREAIQQARFRERTAERTAYDLPSADANDPRGRSDADSFFIYPEQDWDNLRDPIPVVRRPGTPAQARVAAIEGTRRVMTELKKHGDPAVAAAALDNMDMKAPPPGKPAVTAGEVARVEIAVGLAKAGINLPSQPGAIGKAPTFWGRFSSLFRAIPAARSQAVGVQSARAATVEGF